jgi:RND superfamily putative drug exporter
VTQQLNATDDVAEALPSGVHGNDVLITVIPKSGPSDDATGTLVQHLRDQNMLVTGETAVAIDISDRLLHAVPLYLALVAGFAFVLLLVIFRSLLIPLKATLSFLLSLGAALGCTVAIFQWGWLADVFGVDPAGPLLSFLPTIVIGVLFGLSMDYEMFLVAGMRERHAHGVDASESVVSGFQQGAKVVVVAALIMIGVFGGGVVTGSTVVRPIAFALAVGVLVDAFAVRLVLVPAVMALFGRAAWYLPRWLGKIAPRVDVEGSALQEPDVRSLDRPVPEAVMSE